MSRKKKYQDSMPVIEDDMFGIGQSTDFSKSLKEMFSEENIKMKTDLTPKQICKLNVIREWSEYYDIPLLKHLYHRFIALRVSKDRQGRTEAVNMTQQIMQLKRLEAFENSIKGGINK